MTRPAKPGLVPSETLAPPPPPRPQFSLKSAEDEQAVPVSRPRRRMPWKKPRFSGENTHKRWRNVKTGGRCYKKHEEGH